MALGICTLLDMNRTPTTQPPAPLPTHADAKTTLTPKQQRFVEEYLTNLNATQAAIRAGYSVRSAAEQGYDNLRKPQIQAAIASARQRRCERTGIDADRIVLEAWHIATADARELVEVHVQACPHCWKGKPLSDAAPDRACTECFGYGKAQVVLHDVRTLSPTAAALYAGAKQTKYGVEIQMHSKLDALEKLARHLGLYEKDNQQKGDPLTSLLHAIANGNGNGFKPVADDPERVHTADPLDAIWRAQNTPSI